MTITQTITKSAVRVINSDAVKDHVDADAVAPAVARIEEFHRVFDSHIKLSAFWAAFVLWAVALAVSTDTRYLYLAFATSYFGGNPLLLRLPS